MHIIDLNFDICNISFYVVIINLDWNIFMGLRIYSLMKAYLHSADFSLIIWFVDDIVWFITRYTNSRVHTKNVHCNHTLVDSFMYCFCCEWWYSRWKPLIPLTQLLTFVWKMILHFVMQSKQWSIVYPDER